MFSRPYSTDCHYGMGDKYEKTSDKELERHSNNFYLKLLFQRRDYRMTQWDLLKKGAESSYNFHEILLADLDIEQIISMRSKRTEMLKNEPRSCTVQSSPSNRAKCGNCGNLIDHNVLRYSGIIYF